MTHECFNEKSDEADDDAMSFADASTIKVSHIDYERIANKIEVGSLGL
jgi:hypothetical protein